MTSTTTNDEMHGMDVTDTEEMSSESESKRLHDEIAKHLPDQEAVLEGLTKIHGAPPLELLKAMLKSEAFDIGDTSFVGRLSMDEIDTLFRAAMSGSLEGGDDAVAVHQALVKSHGFNKTICNKYEALNAVHEKESALMEKMSELLEQQKALKAEVRTATKGVMHAVSCRSLYIANDRSAKAVLDLINMAKMHEAAAKRKQDETEATMHENEQKMIDELAAAQIETDATIAAANAEKNAALAEKNAAITEKDDALAAKALAESDAEAKRVEAAAALAAKVRAESEADTKKDAAEALEAENRNLKAILEAGEAEAKLEAALEEEEAKVEAARAAAAIKRAALLDARRTGKALMRAGLKNTGKENAASANGAGPSTSSS